MDRRARHDAIARNQARHRRPAPALFVMDELGGWGDLRIGPDGPFVVVDVELRDDIGEVDIGLPIGVDRADVAPIGGGLLAGAHAACREAVRLRLAVLDEVRNDVLAEIARGARRVGVAAQLFDQELRAEDVDAEAGERDVGLARDRRRIGRLFDEVDDPVGLIDVHHAERDRLHPRNLHAGNRDVGATVAMLLEHHFVIHLVDVIAGQDHHIFDVIGLDDVDVLVDRVGGAFIPLEFADPLAGGQDVEAFVAFGAQEVPAALQVADQRMRLVLGRDADAADARIDRVRQREIDDPALAAEIDRGLGARVGQFHQPAAAPARQHIGHRVTR
ncbi:hypothetical protein WR25_20465 [Diploscapter pachys]|uniref:Uncharacterized protein n=1 Tax=Diploscapter pachys TaxID=2018661 RepID=A0A2A2M235_9BILA|nr:hypothetical protein WR25_20465 [Diploscapter pachys]